MNILVTGGAGFIGSHLVDRLLERGHRVAVIDDLSTGCRGLAPDGAELHAIDLCDAAAGEAIDRLRPDAAFHLAAQTSVVRAMREPHQDARVNIRGTMLLLEHLARHRPRVLVNSSTGGAIYGEPDRLPADEDCTVRPTSPYGASKHAAETYCRIFCEGMATRHVSLRYGNVFGPRQSPAGEAGVIAIFADAMLRDRQPVIYGDGKQERDYVFVEDVVDANLRALDSDAEGVFNIGTGLGSAVSEVFAAVARETGCGKPPRHAPARAGEVQRIRLDASRAERVLGWRPRVSFEEGIRRTVEHLRAAGEESDGGTERSALDGSG